MLRLTQKINELERENQSLASSSHENASCRLPPAPPTVGSPANAHEQYIEGNAMMGFNEQAEEHTPQQYSQSDATSFMNLIRSLIDQDKAIPHSHISQISATPPSRSARGRNSTSRRPLPDYVLPSRPQADHLILVYRRLAATLYPFVDLERVELLYPRLWTGEDLGDDGLTFLCLLNVMFSIACNLDSSIAPTERVEKANIFYIRAQDLLQFDIVQQRSLLTVQCFLLLGQYLQSTNSPQQCWIYVGFAIRIAQSLRLDVPSTSAKEPFVQRELLRRLWHGCVLLDQALSMTFGRSTMIAPQASNAVPLPVAHPETTICQCRTRCLSDSSTPDFHFFIETLQLYRLMNETLIILYSSDNVGGDSNNVNVVHFGSLGAKAVGSLLELDHKLSCWYQDLPIHLRHGPDSIEAAVHERHRNVLYIRYTHVKILLFRPILARYCSDGAPRNASLMSNLDTLASKIALQFSVACIRAAFKMIDCFDVALSGKDIGEVDELLPAWWYSIFYVYTAAAVLVAARLSPPVLAEVTEPAVSEAWDTAMRILSRYQAHTNLARRCVTALSLILNQVMQQGQRPEPRLIPDAVELLPRSTDVPEPERSTPTLDEPTHNLSAIHTQDWASFGMEYMDRTGSMNFDSDLDNLLRHMNTSGMQVDIFGDMSWLTDMPSQLY
ncbi:uncharacterized protein A1O9_03092 [Exophiala aquamarina CBS 119918]|uniref:Xylanolytic transcriptional activator regulatory domain-containing protein n=1 Tax=Exophiala aquamarina CBS 119918 TaxID=1182545 RepID=A0A072Q0V3_9EURO|nr:uncharacterized protein A1O9_03092 [Exophiala aquamarina CBS 119918]KEF61525.1 hypothetical protein A1O9_03092 [Exophiala aquamarina CBS 119918]